MTEGNKNHTETEIMLGALDQVIREEMKKRPSKRDNKLIDECIVEMAKLKNVRTGYTEEEIGAIVEQIEAKAAKKTERVPVRRKSVRRVAAVVCAACLIMAGSVAAVAWNPFECVKEWIHETLQLPFGSTLEFSEVTYTRYGETEKYRTIKELIESENLDIYYPSNLPNSVRIQEIEIITTDDLCCLKMYFNDPNYAYTIQSNTPLYIYTLEYETLEYDEIVFYVSFRDNKYIAQANVNSALYLIEAPTRQDMITIISNLIKK